MGPKRCVAWALTPHHLPPKPQRIAHHYHYPTSRALPLPLEQSGVTSRSRALVDRFCRHVDRPDRNHTASTRSLRPALDTSDLSTTSHQTPTTRKPPSGQISIFFIFVFIDVFIYIFIDIHVVIFIDNVNVIN